MMQEYVNLSDDKCSIGKQVEGLDLWTCAEEFHCHGNSGYRDGGCEYLSDKIGTYVVGLMASNRSAIDSFQAKTLLDQSSRTQTTIRMSAPIGGGPLVLL